MSTVWAVGCVLMGVGLSGCAPDWSSRLPKPTPPGQLKLEPPGVGNVSSRVVTISTSTGHEPRLFALKLSESQIKSVRRGEPSATLLEHEVKLLGRPETNDEQESSELHRWQVTQLLGAATDYTVVTDNASLNFKTAEAEPTLLRAWPQTGVGKNAVYCVEASGGTPPLAANPERLWAEDRVWFRVADGGADDGGFDSGEFEGGGGEFDGRSTKAEWTLLAGGSACFLWRGQAEQVPPTHWNGFAVEPATISEPSGERRHSATTSSGGLEPTPSAPCDSREVAIELGCVTVQDDRVQIRPTVTDTLWLVTGDAQGWFVSKQSEAGVVRGIAPKSEFLLRFSVFQATGIYVESDLHHSTSDTLAHVVLNEVLADPAGLEPEGEWVELYNDAANVASLEGWTLEDGASKVELPAVQLAPFGYALLVNDTYERTAALDVVPDEDVFLIRLPSLGKSGLSNQGEALRLVDASGMLISSFPASPKPVTGVSVARREPWLLDAQSHAFGLHAPPFASPGKRNELGIDNQKAPH